LALSSAEPLEEPLAEPLALSSAEPFPKVEEDEVRDIDGMKLNKPYYFQSRIEQRDPVLIIKEDTPQFNSYPRTCSSNMRRQPVILTNHELEKINKEHPGFLRDEDVVTYGSNPEKPFHYICPRYWCLKTNTIIDPKDLKEIKGKDGKTELVHPTCGKVLPIGEKKVKPGYYIYDFNSSKTNKKDYKKYPSLIPDSHPDGYCLPCCFDKYNTEGRIKAMEKCTAEKTGTPKKEKEKEREIKGQEEYIKGPDKFPLDSGRWGYLPAEIQTMLQVSNEECHISKSNTNVKENHPCLLRHGVAINDKQSFINCISDAVFFAKKTSSAILNNKDMKEYIIDSISIDTFIKYQNGNLVSDFQDVEKEADIHAYSDSKLYSKIDMQNPEEKAYFIKVVTAFENFKSFLRDPDAFIDHTYLWDIISMPNPRLFPNGVNLVILQMNDDDITNNVSLLCPTNHYSSEFYQARKPTLLLLKKDEYYEPIYSYTNSNVDGVKNILITKEFKEYDPKLSKNMRAVFKKVIKPFFNLICRPLESMPNVYKTKRALLLYDLVQKLDTYEYTIKKLVINFNNKVIGVVAEEPETGKLMTSNIGFIPCYPSYLDETLKKDLDYVFMTDIGLWNTYENTITFLNKLDRRSKKRKSEPDIPCKPAFKVVEDDHVVGILTITNQFVQLSQPILVENIPEELEIPTFHNNNYIVDSSKQPMMQSEALFTTQTGVDKERVDYIKRIRLETSFYNVFRNTIRILINDYDNLKIREKIEMEMVKEFIIYSEKLNIIDESLRTLVKDKIQFIGDENYYKLMNEVSTCIVKDAESCNALPNLCAVTESGKCNLILPEKNLITGALNEPIYYSRMADELIRYNRIKSFILQPQTYLSFGNIGYNLRDDEMILIQSLLTQDYFESLVPAVRNKYTKYTSHDEVEPVKTQVYDNVIESLEYQPESICETSIKTSITSGIWQSCFPDHYNEIVYNKNQICSFQIILDVIERKTGEKFSTSQIKNQLFEEYKKYLEKYHDKIVDILILEGKKTLGDQVQSGTLSFSNFIYAENYFLTPFDLWLLLVKHKIPTLFISQKTILQAKHEKHEFFAYGSREDDFAFMVIPGLRPENVPGYKIISSDKGDIFISLESLKESCVERIYRAIDESISIETYLQEFTRPKKTIYTKKKPAKPILVESESEDTNEPKETKPKETKPKPNKKILVQSDSSYGEKKGKKKN
jgi:hypothetical protein